VTTPAEELRQGADRLSELAAAAKEATHPGHGDWQRWGVVQNTKWQDYPEPHIVTREEAEALWAFGLAEGGVITGCHVPTGEAFVAHARYAHDQHEDWLESEFFAGPVPEQLARYLAAMDPVIGEALAAWLANRAGLAADVLRLDTPDVPCCEPPASCQGHDPEWGCDLCGQAINAACVCGWKEALTLARAVLTAWRPAIKEGPAS
jgi:hypothetical protein